MTKEQKALLELVKIGASGECCFSEVVLSADWNELFRLAQQQGVVCVAWRAVEILYAHEVNVCPVDVKLQWYAAAEQHRKQMQQKKQVSMEFIEKIGLPCVVLKGLDYCRFWPEEEWRSFGDLDIWAMLESPVSGFKIDLRSSSDATRHSSSKLDSALAAPSVQVSGKTAYEQLNSRAREIGCKVEDDGYYKHSEIRYKGLMVENHQCLTMHDDTRSGKIVESALRELIQEVSSFKFQVSSNLYSPSPTFTALFILAHAHEHFFWEGFSLKIVMDWLFFLLSEEASKVDWQKVEKVLEEAGMKGFMEVMTAFCERQLGLVQSCSSAIAVQDGSKLLDEFTEVVFEEGVEGCKAKQLLHRFHRMWRFRSFLGTNILIRIKNTFVYNYLHKTPNI